MPLSQNLAEESNEIVTEFGWAKLLDIREI